MCYNKSGLFLTSVCKANSYSVPKTDFILLCRTPVENDALCNKCRTLIQKFQNENIYIAEVSYYSRNFKEL